MSIIYPVYRTGRHTKQDPFTLNSFFDDFMNLDDNKHRSNNSPRANITKTDVGYSIQLAAPGFSSDSFDLGIDNNVLLVQMKKLGDTQNASPHLMEKVGYEESIVHREYTLQTFQRSFALPENINSDRISARYESGILYIDVPVENTDRKKRTIIVE